MINTWLWEPSLFQHCPSTFILRIFKQEEGLAAGWIGGDVKRGRLMTLSWSTPGPLSWSRGSRSLYASSYDQPACPAPTLPSLYYPLPPFLTPAPLPNAMLASAILASAMPHFIATLSLTPSTKWNSCSLYNVQKKGKMPICQACKLSLLFRFIACGVFKSPANIG